MKARIGVALAGFGVLFTGCTPLRVFESKVPAPLSTPPEVVESQRAAADLIARKIETPVELKPVAVSLSQSLGAPKKSLVDVRAFDLPLAAHKADSDLQSGLVQMQNELLQLNRRLAALQGKSVEGTGISVLGPSTVLIIGGVIVLGIVFPPAFTFLFMAFRRLRSTAGYIVQGIDEVSKDPKTAETISALKSKLNGEMDILHKRVVHSLQKP